MQMEEKAEHFCRRVVALSVECRHSGFCRRRSSAANQQLIKAFWSDGPRMIAYQQILIDIVFCVIADMLWGRTIWLETWKDFKEIKATKASVHQQEIYDPVLKCWLHNVVYAHVVSLLVFSFSLRVCKKAGLPLVSSPASLFTALYWHYLIICSSVFKLQASQMLLIFPIMDPYCVWTWKQFVCQLYLNEVLSGSNAPAWTDWKDCSSLFVSDSQSGPISHWYWCFL